MIVYMQKEYGWSSPIMRKCAYHIMKIKPLKERPDTIPEMKELWKQEFGIELLLDPTGTGYNRMKFIDEKHYMVWLLKWGP